MNVRSLEKALSKVKNKDAKVLFISMSINEFFARESNETPSELIKEIGLQARRDVTTEMVNVYSSRPTFPNETTKIGFAKLTNKLKKEGVTLECLYTEGTPTVLLFESKNDKRGS